MINGAELKMLLSILKEKYAKSHKCLTPGTIYGTEIHKNIIKTKIKLPMKLNLSTSESIDLESEIHYAIEKVLAKYFED